MDLCLPQFISGGTISFSNPYDPSATNTINNVEEAASDFGGEFDVEYIWLFNNENVPFNNGTNGWLEIDGSTDPFYTIPVQKTTAYYIRCARVVGCDTYWGESNIVEVLVDPCLPQFITAGSISFTNPYDAVSNNTVSSSQDGTSAFGLPMTYRWYSNNEDLPYAGGANNWLQVSGSMSASLEIIDLTAQQYFIRLTTVAGCNNFAATSNTVLVEPQATDPCPQEDMDGGQISFEQLNFDPDATNVIVSTAPAVSPAGPVEYLWASSTTTNNTTVVIGSEDWMILSSEIESELSISTLTQTTYYVRLAKIVDCPSYTGKSNAVTVNYVDPPLPFFAPLNGGLLNTYNVYPSPATPGTPMTLEFLNNQDPQMQVRIRNLSGAQTSLRSYDLVRNEVNKIQVPSDNLSTGMYLMEIKKGSTSEVKRLVIR